MDSLEDLAYCEQISEQSSVEHHYRREAPSAAFEQEPSVCPELRYLGLEAEKLWGCQFSLAYRDIFDPESLSIQKVEGR
jgi:hypothetical protein